MGSNSGSRLYTLTELAGTMCGLQKALVWLCMLLPAALSGRLDWSESVWYLGSWWRKHFDSEYWCLVTDSGELMYRMISIGLTAGGMTCPGLSKAQEPGPEAAP